MSHIYYIDIDDVWDMHIQLLCNSDALFEWVTVLYIMNHWILQWTTNLMMIEQYSSVRWDDMMNNVYEFLWWCGMTLVLCINDDDVEMSMTIYVCITVTEDICATYDVYFYLTNLTDCATSKRSRRTKVIVMYS